MATPPSSVSPWTHDRSRLREWFEREAPSLGELYAGCVESSQQDSLWEFSQALASVYGC